jgi:hypothetical protein
MPDNTGTWYPTDRTLATGVRVTNITVTTTPTSLNALLNTAVSGRSSMAGRRSLKLRNRDSTNPFYILESSTQTITNGWNVEAGSEFSADASETFTENIPTIDVADGGGGFFLACASGTIAVKVLEAK